MPVASLAGVTVLLRRLQAGDRGSLNALVEMVYPELQKLARRCFRDERVGHVLQPTALVNEAYFRLLAHEDHNWQNRAHFFGAAAQIMRRILVDHARANRTRKRLGDRSTVGLDGVTLVSNPASIDVIALDRALTDLEQVAPRQARVVELRYFGGLNVLETAEALQMNARTVDRDWVAARSWLRRRLRP